MSPSPRKQPSKSTPPSDTAAFVQRVHQSFTGEIPKRRVNMGYRLSVFAIALLVLLLPIVYFGLILATAYGTYCYAIWGQGILSYGRGFRLAIFVFMVYLSPIAAGVILVFFMLKSILKPLPKGFVQVACLPEQEPLLHWFAQKIADAVNAPKVRHIEISIEPNASAGFKGGLFGALTGNLVLTIGLPLVASLNTRELAGIIAHELGHFSQGNAMLFHWLVRSINIWFGRMAFERDIADEAMDKINYDFDTDARLTLFLVPATVMLWFARVIAQGFFWMSHFASLTLSRQMEFDADTFEAKLAGSSVFESTTRQINLLGYSTMKAFKDLPLLIKLGTAPNDLPRFLSQRCADMPEAERKQVLKMMRKAKTHWLDTHPCSMERIAAAKALDTPGVFLLEEPARKLFRNFNQLSMAATGDFYRSVFGRLYSQLKTVPVLEVTEEMKTQANSADAGKRYMLLDSFPSKPFPIGRVTLKGSSTNAVETIDRLTSILKKLREDFPSLAQKYKVHSSNFINAREKFEQADKKLRYMDLGFPATAQVPKQLPMKDRQHAEATLAKAREQYEEALAELRPYVDALTKRMSTALELYRLHQDKESESLADLDHLLLVWKTMGSHWDKCESNCRDASILDAMIQERDKKDKPSLFRDEIDACKSDVLANTKQLIAVFSKLDHPFSSENVKSIAKYYVPKMPTDDHLQGIADAASALGFGIKSLKEKLLHELCRLAEEGESSVKLSAFEPDNAHLYEDAIPFVDD